MILVILTARMIVEKGFFIMTKAVGHLLSKYGETVGFLLEGGLNDHLGANTKEHLEDACGG